jgi:hypothetical protein
MGKVKHHSKRALGWSWRKLPWYGKLVAPFVIFALALYLAEAVVSLFS